MTKAKIGDIITVLWEDAYSANKARTHWAKPKTSVKEYEPFLCTVTGELIENNKGNLVLGQNKLHANDGDEGHDRFFVVPKGMVRKVTVYRKSGR